MEEKFFFGLPPELLLILAFILLVIVIFLARRGSKGMAAMAASIPLFWLFMRKMGGDDTELEHIKAEYESKLDALRNEFNLKLAQIRIDLQNQLLQHQLKAETIEHEITQVDLTTKSVIENATPDELEQLAKGLLAVSGKK